MEIVFQNDRARRFESMSDIDKEAYLKATNKGLNAIANRVDEIGELIPVIDVHLDCFAGSQ